ncbi:MAG: hypothetical protein AAFR00_13205 [Pseudomonadota bacterium]
MAKTSIKMIKGGSVKREALTGRLVEVRTPNGVSKATVKTQFVVKGVSSKRSSALKRLVNR